jgi:hypothetical protein
MTELGYFGPYRINSSFVEHPCCWDSAIVRDCTKGKGMYGKGVALICECDEDHAQFICNALNAAIAKRTKPSSDPAP